VIASLSYELPGMALANLGGLQRFTGYDPHGERSVPFNIVVVYSNKVVISKLIYSGYDVYHEGVYPPPFGNVEGTKSPKRKGAHTNEENGKFAH
jgi:hypothetical protein